MDPLDELLDAILTAPDRPAQLRYLRMIRNDVAHKTRMNAHTAIQEAMTKVATLPTPEP